MSKRRKIHLADLAFSYVNRNILRLKMYLQVFFAKTVKGFPCVFSKICIHHIRCCILDFYWTTGYSNNHWLLSAVWFLLTFTCSSLTPKASSTGLPVFRVRSIVVKHLIEDVRWVCSPEWEAFTYVGHNGSIHLCLQWVRTHDPGLSGRRQCDL